MSLVQRVAMAEEQVKSGRIEAASSSGAVIDSTSSITFDFGEGATPPRMRFNSTYTSADGRRTTELIMIGDRYWERTNNGEWVEAGAREGVWGQIQSYLPGVAAAAETSQIHVTDGQLEWTDDAREFDVTLTVDPDTGAPRQLRRVSRVTGTSVIVTYSDWNTPVDIQPPPER